MHLINLNVVIVETHTIVVLVIGYTLPLIYAALRFAYTCTRMFLKTHTFALHIFCSIFHDINVNNYILRLENVINLNT